MTNKNTDENGDLKNTLEIKRILNEAHYLTCTEGSSNKFWGAIEDGNEYVIVWGAIGRAPQSQRTTKRIMQERLREKERKGYVKNSKNPYYDWLSDQKKYFSKLAISSYLFAALEQLRLEEQTPVIAKSAKSIFKRL